MRNPGRAAVSDARRGHTEVDLKKHRNFPEGPRHSLGMYTSGAGKPGNQMIRKHQPALTFTIRKEVLIMKRIGTFRIHEGQSHGVSRAEAATEVHFLETGWRSSSGHPARVAADASRPTPTDDHCQTWGQGLWPDCLD